MNTSKYAPVVLRLGIGMVFIWFGMNQIFDQSMWVSYIPTFITQITGLSATTVVLFNGIFEVCMAVLLCFGFRIRIIATLLFLHMIMIVGEIGLNPVGVRDIGIMFALLSIALQGADQYSVDHLSN